MKKTVMALLAMVVSVMALNNVTLPHSWVTGDTIKLAWIDGDFDTIYIRMNQLNDSLDVKWVRFTDFADSTIGKVKCDSIRSNPDMDSIQGHPSIDTLTVRTNETVSKDLTVTGKITCDTLVGNLVTDSAKIPYIVGSTTVRSGLTVTGQITCDTLVGNLVTDSAKIPYIVGSTTVRNGLTVTGQVTCDTINGNLKTDSISNGGLQIASGKMIKYAGNMDMRTASNAFIAARTVTLEDNARVQLDTMFNASAYIQGFLDVALNATSPSGWGAFHVSLNETYLIGGVLADTGRNVDGSTCVYDSVAHIYMKNKLGSTYTYQLFYRGRGNW